VNKGSQVAYLLSPRAIRERAALVRALADKGKTHFRINQDKLSETSQFVLQITKENYPDLKIPFHSSLGTFPRRWSRPGSDS